MNEITILNTVTGESKNIQCEGYNLQYVDSTSNGSIQKVKNLDNGRYDEKHWLKNNIYRPITEKIRKAHKEHNKNVRYFNPNRVLFIEDVDYVGDETNVEQEWVMKIKKAPAELRTLMAIDFVIISRKFWIERSSENQIIAHLLNCMLQTEEGKLIKPEILANKIMLGNLGYGWEHTQTPIKNLIANIDWCDDDFEYLRKADKQITFNLKAVK